MRGKHRVVVSTKRLKYDFELRRNLTIIRGDSATGKTTLVDMIQDYVNNPSGTPVELVCDKKCYVLQGTLWKQQLSGISDSIVFIDEGNEFIKTQEFAGEIQKTDNYYVIVTREALSSLPYSVEEIYGIRTSGKYGTLKQSYHEFYRIYGIDTYEKDVKPDIVITEDSNSGYQFWRHVFKDSRMISSNGNGNLIKQVKELKTGDTLVIADGAAFGSLMESCLNAFRVQSSRRISLWLPESFEYLILKSNILKSEKLMEIMENIPEYVDCEKYESWENFFTELLVTMTADGVEKYSKSTLNVYYLQDWVIAKIKEQMPDEIKNKI